MKTKRNFMKIKYVFKSMTLWVFLVILLTGIFIGAVTVITAERYNRDLGLGQRVSEVREHCNIVSARLLDNMYLLNPSMAPDITKELSYTAELYNARLIIADSYLTVLFDSYGIEGGKTIVSSEAIRALSGTSNEFYDKTRKTYELAMPIFQGADPLTTDTKNRGVLIINFSVADILEQAKSFAGVMKSVSIVLALVLLAICFTCTSRFSRPFKQISQTLQHVSEGYVDDKVDIHGFSELHRISDQFNEMLKRIAELEDSRQEFVSNVSHELKTPITSMKVLAESIISDPDTPAPIYREFLNDINEEIDREKKIIDDLLALVKMDRKEGDMHIAEVDINEMLRINLKRLRPIASQAGVELLFESFRDVTAEIDEVKLSLAINNLIENAIKYNRENGWVKVSLNSDHRFFIVRVADSGIGIPADSLGKIFDRFYRVDKMRARQTGGTGLGLAIVRSVVQMHNGIIKVESTEGEGSSFTIRIPLSFVPGRNTEIKGETGL